MTLTVPAHWLV